MPRKVDASLYKEIMLKAADSYGWDKSDITDDYINSVYERTGGDVKRYLTGIYKQGGTDLKYLTDDSINELLDSYGVVDKINTPMTSDLFKLGEAIKEKQDKGEVVMIGGFKMVGDGGVEEDILFSQKSALDAIDEYYNNKGELTPPQKMAIASRRWNNAQKGILDKYGNSPEGRKRLNEEYGNIIRDLGLEVVNGTVGVKKNERERYDFYYAGSTIAEKDWGEVFGRTKILQPKDYAENAKVLNEEFKSFPREEGKEESRMPLRTGMEIGVGGASMQAAWDAANIGKEEAARLFNDATLKLYDRYEDALNSGAIGNFAKGTGSGLRDFAEEEFNSFVNFGKNNEVVRLNRKLDTLIDGMDDDRSMDEKRDAAYKMLTPKEQNLLNSFSNYYGALSSIAPDMPLSRRLGESFGQSLGFMAEFMISGASGGVKAGVKAGAKALAKGLTKQGMNSAARVAGNVAERLGRGEATRLFLRPGGKFPSLYKVGNKVLTKGVNFLENQVFAIPEATLQTLVQPTFYNEVSERMALGDDFKKAFCGAWYDQTTENWSEKMFVGSGELSRLTGSAINFNKLKRFKGVIELAKSTAEEYAEELAGDFVRRIPDWRDENFARAYSDYWDDKWDTFLSVGIMTGTLGGAGYLANKSSDGVNKVRYKGKVDIARKALPENLANNIDELLENTSIDDSDAVNTIGQFIEASSRANNVPLGKLATNVNRYLSAKLNQEGFNIAVESYDEEGKRPEKMHLNDKEVERIEMLDDGRARVTDVDGYSVVVDGSEVQGYDEHGKYLGKKGSVGNLVEDEEGNVEKVEITDENIGKSSNFDKNLSEDEVSKPISQGEYGAETSQDGGLEEVAVRFQEGSRVFKETDGGGEKIGTRVRTESSPEVENRVAESYAKEKGIWKTLDEVTDLGDIGPSGNENDTYISPDGDIFKVNNLSNSHGSVSEFVEKTRLHNQLFPETSYELAGFTGREGKSVYPIVKQRYVPNSTNATVDEIDNYMESLGFEKTGDYTYSNGVYEVSDLRPRNVLKDADGDIYVIDSEIKEKETKDFSETQENDVLSREVGDDARIGRSLNSSEAEEVLKQMQVNADVASELELTPENWVQEFGEDGKVQTPIGEVKMGDNQYLKLLKKKRGSYFGMIKPTLANPDIVLEEHDPKEGAERDTKYLFVKTFEKPDGSRYVHFESVTVQKDNLEVSISSHEITSDALIKKVQQNNLLHLNDKFSSSEMRLTEPQNEGSDLVPAPNSISSSAVKDKENISEKQDLDSIMSDLTEELRERIEDEEREIADLELEERRHNIERKGVIVNVDGRRKRVSKTKNGEYNTKNEKAIQAFDSEVDRVMDEERKRIESEMPGRVQKKLGNADRDLQTKRKLIEDGRYTLNESSGTGMVSIRDAEDMQQELFESTSETMAEISYAINKLYPGTNLNRYQSRIIRNAIRNGENIERIAERVDAMLKANGKFKQRLLDEGFRKGFRIGNEEVRDKIKSTLSVLNKWRNIGKLSDKQYKDILKKLSRKDIDIEVVLSNIDKMIVDNAFRAEAYAAKVRQEKRAELIGKRINKMMLPDWLSHDMLNELVNLDMNGMNPAMLHNYDKIMEDLARTEPRFSSFIPEFLDEYKEQNSDENKTRNVHTTLEDLEDRLKRINKDAGSINTPEEYRRSVRDLRRTRSDVMRWFENKARELDPEGAAFESLEKERDAMIGRVDAMWDGLADAEERVKKGIRDRIKGDSGMLSEAMKSDAVKGTPFYKKLDNIRRYGIGLKGLDNLELKELLSLENALFNVSIGVPTRGLDVALSKLVANEMGKRLEKSKDKIEAAANSRRVRKYLDDVEKLKDWVDIHDFSMLDTLFDSGKGKDLYENFFVPFIESAVVEMDKEKALTLVDFGEKLEALENLFFSVKAGRGTIVERVTRGGVQKYKDLVGMMMTQLDYESNTGGNFEDIPKEQRDYFGYLLDKRKISKGGNLRDRTAYAHQIMKFDKNGRLDVDGTLESLGDKKLVSALRNLMKSARATLDGRMKDYYVANAIRRGVRTDILENYFPRFVRKSLASKSDGEIDFLNIYSNGKLMPTTMPTSLNNRVAKKTPNPVEIDVSRIMSRAVTETFTDYFLAPAFSQANSALIGVIKKGGKAADAFEVIRGAMRDRLVKNYRRELSKEDLKKVRDLDRWVAKMARTLMLAKIPKTVAEFGSNQLGALISDGAIGWSYYGNIDVLHELADKMNLTAAKNIVKYNEMFRDSAGGKMSAGEKGINKLITINDEWTSSAIYYKTFNKLFKEYSGEAFDYTKAKTDDNYRKWVVEDHDGERSFFERAHIGAVTRAQESFTTVNRALSATRTPLLFGKGMVDVDSLWARSFGFMMSFSTNESFEFARGWREFAHGIKTKDRDLVRDGVGRMSSRFVRSATYSMFMQAIGNAIAAAAKGDSPEPPKFDLSLLSGTCIQLALGRYGNSGGFLLNVALGVLGHFDKQENGNTKMTRSIVDAINNGAGIYATPISLDNKAMDWAKKVLPHWAFVTNIVVDSSDMVYDIFKKLSNGEELSDDEQTLWGMISLTNAMFTMFYPNPVTTTGYNVGRTVESSYKRDKYEEKNKADSGRAMINRSAIKRGTIERGTIGRQTIKR